MCGGGVVAGGRKGLKLVRIVKVGTRSREGRRKAGVFRVAKDTKKQRTQRDQGA